MVSYLSAETLAPPSNYQKKSRSFSTIAADNHRTMSSIKKNKNSRPVVKCPMCQKKLSSPHNLTIHLRTHTGERPYKCTYAGADGTSCSKSFAQSGVRDRHLQTHSDVKKYCCPQCPKKFTSHNNLRNHILTHDDDGEKERERPFGCLECGKTFLQKHVLEIHLRVHTGEKPYGCALCQKSFAQKSVLDRHLRTHTTERPYPCGFCGASFAVKATLEKHMTIHTGERAFKCQVCPATFSTQQGRRSHSMIHQIVDRSFSCTVVLPDVGLPCGKLFKSSKHLRIHMKRHGGQKKIVCPTCHRPFFDKGDLIKHMVTHTKEKKFQCDICHKYFVRNSVLNLHVKNVHLDRPHVCGLCDQTFVSEDRLQCHLGWKHGEKVFVCKFGGCDKVFNLKIKLQIHARVHTGEKPYGCQFCKMEFAQAGVLGRHVQRKHQHQ